MISQLKRYAKRFFWLSDIMITGRARPPRYAIIEPAAICNLRCPICPTGSGTSDRPHGIMSLETFDTILRKIPSLQEVYLYNFGEPFLNPHLLEMVRRAKAKGLKVIIHSNFSLKFKPGFFDEIVRAGIDDLTLSVDGASQETYEKYRVGGDFNLVISNMREMVAAKKRLGSELPVITWKFILNRFSHPELDKAAAMAAEIGVVFNQSQMSLADNAMCYDLAELERRKRYWWPEHQQEKKIRYPIFHSLCIYLFEFIVIGADGKVFPCCNACSDSDAFGDILSQSFEEVWYNEKFTAARRHFIPALFRKAGRTPSPCSRCRIYCPLHEVVRHRLLGRE